MHKIGKYANTSIYKYAALYVGKCSNINGLTVLYCVHTTRTYEYTYREQRIKPLRRNGYGYIHYIFIHNYIHFERERPDKGGRARCRKTGIQPERAQAVRQTRPAILQTVYIICHTKTLLYTM